MTANGMYFNTRTMVLPSEALKMKTPFAFSISILPQITESPLNDEGTTDSTGQTGTVLLKFMNVCSSIFMQDATEVIIRKSERRDHPLCRRLGLF